IHLRQFSLDNDDENYDLIEQWTPERLNRCIYLDSAVNEVLRLTSAPMMLQKCCQKTEANLHDGRILNVQPNEAVALYPAASHYDENQFSKSTIFIFDRFVHQNMEIINGFMPFGTGKSKCPGRFFAKYEMKIWGVGGWGHKRAGGGIDGCEVNYAGHERNPTAKTR
ncbi:unnamed protein product, partial [Rotaria sp. Silwood2]